VNAKGGDALGSQARPRGPQSVLSSQRDIKLDHRRATDGALVRPEDGLHEVRMIGAYVRPNWRKGGPDLVRLGGGGCVKRDQGLSSRSKSDVNGIAQRQHRELEQSLNAQLRRPSMPRDGFLRLRHSAAFTSASRIVRCRPSKPPSKARPERCIEASGL
jgi:hypothetical protein